MHLDFYQTIHQANHGIQGWIFGWCFRCISDPRFEPLVSQCTLFNIFSSQKAGPFLQEIAHLWFSQFWRLIISLTISGHWARLKVKGRILMWHLTRPINPLFILVETFRLRLGRTFWSRNLLATMVSSIAWPLFPANFWFSSSLYSFATLIYTSLKIATASIAFLDQEIYMIYIFICLMILLYLISIYNSPSSLVDQFYQPFVFTDLLPCQLFLAGKVRMDSLAFSSVVWLISAFVILKLWDRLRCLRVWVRKGNIKYEIYIESLWIRDQLDTA